MIFPVIKFNLEDANEFVKYWSSLYNYPNYDVYLSRITKPALSVGDLKTLFEWKNGMILSDKKSVSFTREILKKGNLIFELKKKFDFDKFKKSFGDMSVVWQVFLLHIISPSNYPIFDQHVYRAFRFIKYGDLLKLPLYKKTKMNVFNEEYHPFFNEIKAPASNHNSFEIDKALWSFGKFIKEYSIVNNLNR